MAEYLPDLGATTIAAARTWRHFTGVGVSVYVLGESPWDSQCDHR